MLKMDTHTKQVFYAGIFAYFSSITGALWYSTAVDAVQQVEIAQLEKGAVETSILLKGLSSSMVSIQTKNATIEVMLQTINNSVVQLDKTTAELSNIAARLDERSKIIQTP